MGFWEFFQPGDLRHASTSSSPSNTPAQAKPALLDEPAPVDSSSALSTGNSSVAPPPRRSNRNAYLFFGGAAFFAFSVISTRRAFARRRVANQIAQLSSSTSPNATGAAAAAAQQQPPPVIPALEAVEALNIATINVLSLAMMATGGTLWYLNINSLDDARKFIRGGLGVDGRGKSEDEANEEIEEFLAGVLSRRDAKRDREEDSREEIERLRREVERLKKER